MDRLWMLKDRRSKDYKDGVEQFMNFARIHATTMETIRCPCEKCGNIKVQPFNEIRNHLFFHGIDQSYQVWIWHGEAITSQSVPCVDSPDYDHEQFDTSTMDDAADAVEMVKAAHDQCAADPEMFKKLLEDAEKPLYPGCRKFTKLSVLVKLFNFKASSGLSNKSFTDLLMLLGELLPVNNELPLSMYEAKKTLSTLGMEYEKIHACPNDCILYRKEYADLTSCPTCEASRWKLKKNSTETRDGVPAKVLWYFPPIPRFQRMFHSAETANDLTWHARQRNTDGLMHHPSDSPSWKLVDNKWPDFGSESRNLRLALSTDGINPHGSLSSRYSCWPVILVTYNLPRSLWCKRKFMMLSLLISGPQQPENDIDVYLAPLVDDLKLLWEVGVEAYDACRREHFRLRVVLLWTINDFPAYGNLSGKSVKGTYACPICCEETHSVRLTHGHKEIFDCHRVFLPLDHPFRRLKKAFNGRQEFRKAPSSLSGEDILRKVTGINNLWGKKRIAISSLSQKKRKKRGKSTTVTPVDGKAPCWKKKSIFFELEYWKDLLVRHNLDVMHIEKNVCESIFGTLLQIPGKTKDNLKSRQDLQDMGLRTELAPREEKGKKKGFWLPPSGVQLNSKEKRVFCDTLYNIKVPQGYSSNFRSLVSMSDLKLYGLKSHDCHVLMQQLLPVAIRSLLEKHVRYAIIRLCFFFNALCSKVVDVSKLDELQKELVVTLCLLEKYYPPSFFDIMVHLTVHLVKEVKLCGPVCFRWMYPFERYMKVLKGYVRNRNCPEGCIAESYIAEETVEFCAEFLVGVDAIGVPSARDKATNDSKLEKPLSGLLVVNISHEEWEQAHRYVLGNTSEVEPYIDEHMALLKHDYPRQRSQKWLQNKHNKQFMYWLQGKVSDQLKLSIDISNTLKWIAHGPRLQVLQCSGYDINGCRYHPANRERSLVHQNSGVKLVATTMQVTGYKDQNPLYSDLCYYGVITEIWLLDYYEFTLPMFKCKWVDINKGVKVDELGYTLVNLNEIGDIDEPFILASQAKQVFYVEDQLNPNWSIVLETPKKENPFNEDDELNDHCMDHGNFTKVLPRVDSFDVNDDSMPSYMRPDGEGTWIEHT